MWSSEMETIFTLDSGNKCKSSNVNKLFLVTLENMHFYYTIFSLKTHISGWKYTCSQSWKKVWIFLFVLKQVEFKPPFYHGPLVKRGCDQQMAILLLLLLLLLQSSIRPIRAKQINWCSSVIGWQYWGQGEARCGYTSVQSAEKVYTECIAKHWAEQSVCTSLDGNAVTHSVLLGSKNVRKGGALIF